MAWLGVHLDYVVDMFVKNNISAIAVQRAFPGKVDEPTRFPYHTPIIVIFLWGYLKSKVYSHRSQT